MNWERRNRYARITAFLFAPILLPVVGFYIALDTYGRALSWPTLPRPWWLNRIWWVYGYRGLYQLDWWLKRRAAQ